jgi:uncharacterized membrane protein YgcG
VRLGIGLMKQAIALLFVLIPASGLFAARTFSSSNSVITWPLEISGSQGVAVVYQPQPESFKDDKITARVAVSAQPKGAKAPIFGAAWIVARVSTDRDAGTVTVIDVEVPKVKLANGTPEQEKAFGDFVGSYLTQMHSTFPLEVLMASLAVAEREKLNAGDLKNDAPKIIFATSPTVLVTIDGEPQLRAIENSSLIRVVNTPFALLFDRDSKKYLLRSGNNWMSAADLSGPWKIEKNVPPAAKAVIPKEMSEPSGTAATDETEPTIVVSKEPAELVVTDGEMQLTPMPDNELLYASNTEGDVFLEVASGNYFLLTTGRWYTAPALEGPWTFVASDKLPGAFAHIPSGSPKADVLVSVAGTPQADDAVLDASIPQTKEIDRAASVDLKVDYDGDPKFENVEGTSLQSAANTSRQIISSAGKYYLCDQAVWYESESAKGPWAVSDSVPKEIYTIPPSNPNYNVTYVRVYNSTPTIVRVGYLPGYVGSYVYGPTVVFGTGYIYRPWLGAYYYPRPLTWGVRVAYNPYAGSWAYAPVYPGWYGAAMVASSVYWGGVNAGWWGAGGCHYWGNSYNYKYKYEYKYKYKYPPNYRPPNNNNRPPNWSNGNGNRPPNSTLPSNRPGYGSNGRPGNDNIYNRPSTLPADRARPGNGATTLPSDRTRPGQGASTLPADKTRPGTGASQLPADKSRPGQGQISTRPAKSPNDVLTDKSGNVYRKSGNDWQQRDKSGWSKPAGGQSDFTKNRTQLERDNFSRQRGQQMQSSNRGGNSSLGGGRGGGGGSRGGGGRRR